MNKKRRATLEKPLLSDWRSSKAQWNMATPVHPAERCMVGPFVECHAQFRSAHQTHADTCSSLFIPGTDRVGERERRQRFNLVSTFKFLNRLCSWKASNPKADGKETSPVQRNNIFREQSFGYRGKKYIQREVCTCVRRLCISKKSRLVALVDLCSVRVSL